MALLEMSGTVPHPATGIHRQVLSQHSWNGVQSAHPCLHHWEGVRVGSDSAGCPRGERASSLVGVDSFGGCKRALVRPRSSSENDQTAGVVEHHPFLMRQGVGAEDTGVGANTGAQ